MGTTLIHGELNSTYHSNTSISSTQVKTFTKSSQLFKDTQDGLIKRKQTDAFSYGTAIHSFFLEPDKFDSEIIVKPIGHNGRTKEGKQWVADAKASGKIVITDEQMHGIKIMQARMPNEIKAIFRKGDPEVVARTEVNGVMVQARFDWLADDAIYDIKSCQDLEQLAVKDCFNYKYFVSAAFYQMVHKAVTGEHKPYRIVAIEKDYPFRSQLMDIDDDMIAEGIKVIDSFFLGYKNCLESGNWSDDLPIVREDLVDLPGWRYREMDREGEE